MNYGFILRNGAQDPQLKTATMEIMSEVWRFRRKKLGGLNHDLMGFHGIYSGFWLGFWLGIEWDFTIEIMNQTERNPSVIPELSRPVLLRYRHSRGDEEDPNPPSYLCWFMTTP